MKKLAEKPGGNMISNHERDGKDMREYGDVNVHTQRLAVASMALLAALPGIMTFARTSPPLIAAIIAVLLGIILWLDGRWSEKIGQWKRFAIGPAGLLLILGIGFMALSIIWTPAPERALRHLFHIIGSVVLIALLLAAASVRYKDSLDTLMPIGMALSALLIIVHFGLDGTLNQFIGAPTDAYQLNRAAIALALFAPAVLTVLVIRRKTAAAILLGLLTLFAIWMTVSWSAKLSSLVIVLSAPLALLAPRRFHIVASVAILISLIATPLYVGHINSLIPQNIHDTVGYGSMAIRGEIWREYAALVWERPLFGFGLEASNVSAHLDYAASLTEKQRYFLSYGHPHNAAVQIWFEFGLFGAMIAALLLALLLRAMSRLKGVQLSIATTTSLGVYTVSFVSHGAWQAWWICLVGLVAFAFALQAAAMSGPAAKEPHVGEA